MNSNFSEIINGEDLNLISLSNHRNSISENIKKKSIIISEDNLSNNIAEENIQFNIYEKLEKMKNRTKNILSIYKQNFNINNNPKNFNNFNKSANFKILKNNK